ncbi:MAG: hypothetical protein WBF73_17810 [Bradyrhizobium sp.]
MIRKKPAPHLDSGAEAGLRSRHADMAEALRLIGSGRGPADQGGRGPARFASFDPLGAIFRAVVAGLWFAIERGAIVENVNVDNTQDAFSVDDRHRDINTASAAYDLF